MPGLFESVMLEGQRLSATRWREELSLQGATAEAVFADGGVAISRNKLLRYVATWLDATGWYEVMRRAAMDAGLTVMDLPATLRVSRIGDLTIALNFSDAPVTWRPADEAQSLVGGPVLPPRGVAIWRGIAAAS